MVNFPERVGHATSLTWAGGEVHKGTQSGDGLVKRTGRKESHAGMTRHVEQLWKAAGVARHRAAAPPGALRARGRDGVDQTGLRLRPPPPPAPTTINKHILD